MRAPPLTLALAYRWAYLLEKEGGEAETVSLLLVDCLHELPDHQWDTLDSFDLLLRSHELALQTPTPKNKRKQPTKRQTPKQKTLPPMRWSGAYRCSSLIYSS